jgi:hypothetical protein
MLRTFFDFDSTVSRLGKTPYFKRYKSLSELPFNVMECENSTRLKDETINHYREMITKQLISKFAVPTLKPSDHGILVNTDLALDGTPECYLHVRPARSVLKLGLNISADSEITGELMAMRCAAVLAIWQLAKSRGQKVQFDVCYGYFGVTSSVTSEKHTGYKYSTVHVRVTTPTMTVNLLKRIMSDQFWGRMIKYVVMPLCGSASYRISEIKKATGKDEFDFCLDRLETSNPETEYQRILTQIERLRQK